MGSASVAPLATCSPPQTPEELLQGLKERGENDAERSGISEMQLILLGFCRLFTARCQLQDREAAQQGSSGPRGGSAGLAVCRETGAFTDCCFPSQNTWQNPRCVTYGSSPHLSGLCFLVHSRQSNYGMVTSVCVYLNEFTKKKSSGCIAHSHAARFCCRTLASVSHAHWTMGACAGKGAAGQFCFHHQERVEAPGWQGLPDTQSVWHPPSWAGMPLCNA